MRQPTTRRSAASRSQPQEPQQSPSTPRVQKSTSRSLAPPHSSGDTVPMDIAMHVEPMQGVATGSSQNVNGHHLPVRSSPAPAHRSVSASPATLGAEEQPAMSSLDILGDGVKVLLHAISDLERHGIDASIPLPKIVAIGDQSAGKSSLIEAISEISLPKDSGTCTRCPFLITLHDEPGDWRCDVSLVKKYNYLPNFESELHPWSESEQEVKHFATVSNKSELEKIIRGAQLATLNPSQHHTQFLLKTESQAPSQVSFSPNIVSLEIFAPGLPNLSFYDLPGIISQSDDGRKETPELIRQLARHYISQESTIVLLAVPMESDIDNSMASALVTQVDARDRTMGVLTKPDRLQTDDRVDNWKLVLNGKKFQMGYGYFAVKQLNQAELKQKMTHAQARASEEAFFASQRWTSRFGKDTARLGTRNLQRDLSTRLAQLILETMPSLESRVFEKLNEVEAELGDYPEPPANAMQVVHRAVIDFAQLFKKKLEGTPPSELSESWKAVRTRFQNEISGQRPTVTVNDAIAEQETYFTPKKLKTPGPSRTPGRLQNIVEILSDEEEISTPTRKRPANNQTPKAKIASPVKRDPITKQPKSVFRKIFSLHELRMTLDSFSTSGLPSGIEPKAVDELILRTLKNWHNPTDKIVAELRTALTQALLSTLEQTVREWRTTKLFRDMETTCLAFLEHQLNHMSVYINRALKIECTKPVTRNERLIKQFTDEDTKVLYEARLKDRAKSLMGVDGEEPFEWDDRKRKATIEQLGPDPFQREIEVMAGIRAYYDLASMRFIDQVVQSVEAELFVTFRDGLRDELISELHLLHEDGQKHANELVAEDAEREHQRAALKDKKAHLQQAAERLTTMNKQFYDIGVKA